MNTIEISVVIPVYNEEKNISVLIKRTKKALTTLHIPYEILFVNDGSTDSTLLKIKKYRQTDRNIKYVSFSRNFGHMSAVDAGLSSVKGKYVVLLDGDLQDPPEEIPNLYKKIKKGYKVVYGVKKKRKEGPVRRFMFENFYKVLNLLSDYKMPKNAGTFSIMQSEVVKILTDMPERNKYFSGLRAWTGFKQTGYVYEREARYAGKPASFKRLLHLALDGIFSFSYTPLRLASVMGFIFASISFLFIFIVILIRLFFTIGILGWASTLSVILFIGGIQLITLGIIGEYLGRIYDEVKARPKYIISEKGGIR